MIPSFSLTKLFDNIKVPLLLGDRFHTKAYYLTAQLGLQGLCHVLALIDENFAKLAFTLKPEPEPKHETTSVEQIHESLYYYLPNFYKNAIRFGAAERLDSGVCAIVKPGHEEGLQLVGQNFGFYLEYYAIARSVAACTESTSKVTVRNTLRSLITKFPKT